MSNAEIKEILINFIKEAKYSKDNDLELIPGTTIRLKKGKQESFLDAAREYYIKVKNKSSLGVSVEKIMQEVYDELSDELDEILLEDLSNVYDIFSLNINEIEEANNLIESLSKIKEELEKNEEARKEALSVKNVATLRMLQENTASLLEQEEKTSSRLNDIRNLVNDRVLEKIEIQLKYIEDNLETASKFTTTVFEKNSGKKILKYDEREYKSLLALKDILTRIKDDEYEKFVTIDGLFIAPQNKLNRINQLIPNISIFKHIKIDVKRLKEENEKLINELQEYLNILIEKCKDVEKNSVRNVKTRQIDKNLVVLEEDYFEYIRIAKIIEILGRQSDDIVNVWGIGNVRQEDVSEFKKYINSTIYFKDRVPKIKSNEKEIDNIHQEIYELYKTAQQLTSGSYEDIMDNLKNNPKYNLLVKKRNILELSRASENLVDIDGIKVDSQHVDEYNFINKELLQLNKRENLELLDNKPLEIEEQPKETLDNEPPEMEEQPKETLDNEPPEIEEQPKETLDNEPPEMEVQPKETLDNEPPEMEEQPKETLDNEPPEMEEQPKEEKKNWTIRKLNPVESENFRKEEIKVIIPKGLTKANIALTIGALGTILLGTPVISPVLALASGASLIVRLRYAALQKQKISKMSEIQKDIFRMIDNKEITDIKQFTQILEQSKKNLDALEEAVKKMSEDLSDEDKKTNKYVNLRNELSRAEYVVSQLDAIAKDVAIRIDLVQKQAKKEHEKQEKEKTKNQPKKEEETKPRITEEQNLSNVTPEPIPVEEQITEEESKTVKRPRIRIPYIYRANENNQKLLNDILQYFNTRDHHIKNHILGAFGIELDKYLVGARVQDALDDIATQLELPEEELLKSLETELDELYKKVTISEFAELNKQLYAEEIRILEERINELKGRGR